jgi:predicted Kef-type K+ transport protein
MCRARDPEIVVLEILGTILFLCISVGETKLFQSLIKRLNFPEKTASACSYSLIQSPHFVLSQHMQNGLVMRINTRINKHKDMRVMYFNHQ